MNKFVEKVIKSKNKRDEQIFANAASEYIKEVYDLDIIIKVKRSTITESKRYSFTTEKRTCFSQHWVFYFSKDTEKKMKTKYGKYFYILDLFSGSFKLEETGLSIIHTGTSSPWYAGEYEIGYHSYVTIWIDDFMKSFEYIYADQARKLLLY